MGQGFMLHAECIMLKCLPRPKHHAAAYLIIFAIFTKKYLESKPQVTHVIGRKKNSRNFGYQ